MLNFNTFTKKKKFSTSPQIVKADLVGFVPGSNNTVRLVTLEHDLVTLPRLIHNGTVERFKIEGKPIRHIYTPEEWVMFYYGVKAGEFNDQIAGEILIRDSKDPDGSTFVLSKDIARAFFDSIDAGKYDLPQNQEASIAAFFPED